MRNSFLYPILLLTALGADSTAQAQDLKFDKKSGDFSASSGPVAKLTDEKVKPLGGKNYYLKGTGSQATLISWTLHRFEDTLGGPSVYYYTIDCPALSLTAWRPNFTGMLNTFKEVGELVVAGHLLAADGALNEPAVRAYFATATTAMGNYPARLQAMQDSMLALVSTDAPPVERDMRKPITANEFGKIGQGNVAIGAWEFIETKGEGINSSTYHFRIKNSAGGIVCISWINLSGAHTYVYKGGARSEDDWQLPDFIHNNPIQNKEAYVVQLATRLVKAGLL